jgi:hypothetical protein
VKEARRYFYDIAITLDLGEKYKSNTDKFE